MNFAFADEQLEFQRVCREFLAAECPPEHVRAMWESPTGRAPQLWARLVELGIVGLTVPEEQGGLGLDERDFVLLLEESGRAALPEPLVETTAVAVPLLRELEAGAEWLAGVAAGEAILTVGLDRLPFVADAHVADVLLLQRDDELHAVPRQSVALAAQPSVDRARRLFSVEWQPGEATLVAAGEKVRSAAEAAFDRGAPKASAATSPRPSRKPPAATTGTSTAPTTCGRRRVVATLPVCPPPSPPCAMRTSAPSSTAFTACRTAPTVGTHRTPPSFSFAMKRGFGERL